MRKSLEAIKGDKLQNIRNNKVYTVADICGQGMVLIDEETLLANHYTNSNIKRWFRMYEQYVAPVEPVQPVLPQYNVTKEDVINVIQDSGCTSCQKKQYLGAYKEGQRGPVCMVRFTRTAGIHIDMKPSVYQNLPAQYRRDLETTYDTGIYDRSRGYFRISEVHDLEVLKKVILAATK